MNEIEAFIVGRVENLGKECWSIDGRACEDISIGDILKYDSKSTSGNAKLKVLSISSYGREITTLYRMMTGFIVVGAKQEVELESIKMLYK